MSMSVKPGYINPLSMMGQNKDQNGFVKNPLSQPKQGKGYNVQDLQNKQQALQNNILLLKSTSDGASLSGESQEILTEQLEEVQAELNTAKLQEARSTAETDSKLTARLNFDTYEASARSIESPGLYEVLRDQEKGYQISFHPYKEAK